MLSTRLIQHICGVATAIAMSACGTPALDLSVTGSFQPADAVTSLHFVVTADDGVFEEHIALTTPAELLDEQLTVRAGATISGTVRIDVAAEHEGRVVAAASETATFAAPASLVTFVLVPEDENTDGGPPDGGLAESDAGPSDGGAPPDGGVKEPDAGPSDGGPPADGGGGETDAGSSGAFDGGTDAGSPDGGTDAGSPDGGGNAPTDAGLPDAARPIDAGSPADAGPSADGGAPMCMALQDTGGPCPELCENGCAGGVCEIDCTSSKCEDDVDVFCPEGYNCFIDCTSGCAGNGDIVCPTQGECIAFCQYGSACNGNGRLRCGGGPCLLQYEDVEQLTLLDCGESCSCETMNHDP